MTRAASDASDPDALSYEQAGVDYDLIDPLKVAAQRAAAATGSAPRRARLQRSGGLARRIGLRRRRRPVLPREHRRVPRLEGAGRRRDAALTGRATTPASRRTRSRWRSTTSITVGATPLVVQAYWAAGGSDWFADARARAGAGRRLEARLRRLRRRLGRRRDAGARRHRRGAAASTSRPSCTGIVNPKAAAVARRRARRPATRSCCSLRAASTPTASAWRASWPSACRRAT